MSTRQLTPSKSGPVKSPSFTAAHSALLQRKCACGGTPGPTGECDACRKQKLQRRPSNLPAPSPNHPPSSASEVPPIVHEVLRSPGQPLAAVTRAFMEPRFGRDFSRIPVTAGGSGVLHFKMTTNRPNDVFEEEADWMAERVSRLAEPPVRSLSPQSSQSFSTSRFGRDFSQVRVHTDVRAAEAARAVNAEAFTVGDHIVFGPDRYAPHMNQGQRLLAHELTHCVQQQTTGPRLQRKLSVDKDHPTAAPVSAPANDPAASLTSAMRFSMMDSLIQGLCDEFEVDNSGEVLSKARTSLAPADLATGSKPTGCCCLNVLTNSGDWKIEVSQVIGAQTFFATQQVVLNPTTTPVEFGAFTAAGTVAFQGAVPTAGHELCGHAALQELRAHPASQDRTTSDVHDPTVRIENLVSTEQGVPPAELRGLAASGPHRGESVDHITIQNYPLNSTDVPASERSKIDFAAAYILANEEFVDVLGHSDSAGSPTAKQQVSDRRAAKAKKALRDAGVPERITKFSLTNVNRFSRVEGLSDTQPPAPPLDSNQDNWRRVDILMAGFPAGAQRPPAGTPATVTAHAQSSNVPALKTSQDPCVRLLVGGAYP